MFLSRLLSKLKRRSKPASTKRRSLPLQVEALEQRDVPTVVFPPAFGAETVYWRSTNNVMSAPVTSAGNGTALQDPTYYLIFWGKNWTNATAKQFASDAQSITSSNYLSGLTQYGTSGNAKYGAYAVDNSADPVGSTRDQEIQKILPQQKTWLQPTDKNALDSPIYIVVFDINTGKAANGVGSYTTPSGQTVTTNAVNIDVGYSPSNVDGFTDLFTHELAERISDGSGNGIGLNFNYNTDNEGSANMQVSDGEPNVSRYTTRLNGLLVQAYWSMVDQAFIIPDGSSQRTVYEPIWKGTGNFTNEFAVLQQGNLSEVTNPASSSSTLIDTKVMNYTINEQNGNVYYLTSAGVVKDFNGSSTTTITGPNTVASSLAGFQNVGGNFTLYMAASNSGGANQVWQYNGSGTSWTSITAAGVSVSQLVAAQVAPVSTKPPVSALFMLSNNQVSEYSGVGTKWNNVSRSGYTVTAMAAAFGNLFELANFKGGANELFEYQGSSTNWMPLTDSTQDLGFLVSANDCLYYTDSASGGSASVRQYLISSSNIVTASTNTVQLITAGNVLYMVTAASNGNDQVWQYTGSGTAWTDLTTSTQNVFNIGFDGNGLYGSTPKAPGFPNQYRRTNYQGNPGKWS